MNAPPFIAGTKAFPAGSSVLMHGRNGSEQVTILEGRIMAESAGLQSEPGSMGASFVPARLPHRVVNTGECRLKILWVHAAAEVTRTFTDTGETVPHLPRRDKV